MNKINYYNNSIQWLKEKLPVQNKTQLLQEYQNEFEPKIILLSVEKSKPTFEGIMLVVLNKSSFNEDKYKVVYLNQLGLLNDYLFEKADFEKMDSYLKSNNLSVLSSTYHAAAITVPEFEAILNSKRFDEKNSIKKNSIKYKLKHIFFNHQE